MINIKICTYPNPSVSVHHDIEIIKSVLLYADRLELVSPNTTLILAVLAIPYLPEHEKLDLIKSVFPYFNPDKEILKQLIFVIDKYEAISKKSRKVGPELKLFLSFRDMITKQWSELKDSLESQFKNTGIEELLPAVEAGILKVNLVGIGSEGNQTDQFVKDLVRNVEESISSQDMYPLFDENIGEFVGSMANAGLVQFSSIEKDRVNHIALTSNVLSRLPKFPNCGVDELVDIRNDLSRYLTNFRSAMSKYSSQIKSLPWDRDFPKECEKIQIEHIDPSIEAIEDHVRSNSYLGKLLKTVSSEPLAVGSTTGLGFMISQLSALSTLSSVGLGIAAGTTVALTKSIVDWKDTRNHVEQNQLYFYYRAGKKSATF